ncbi:MAG: response regulator transcription factor [Eubacteriales bacterium]|nr:response regulator transcription factor [Eubacteriales bacterium]
MSKKYKILVAEDFDVIREDIVELIQSQADMTVVGEAVSGREIVELAKKTEYDIILMDIEMEHMHSGIQATYEIMDGNPEAKIIFLTAHETKQMIINAMGAGAVDYIVKGTEDEEILKHIRGVIEGNSVMQQKIQETIMQEYVRLQKSERSLLFFINNISKLTSAERDLIKLLLEGHKVNEIAGIRSVETSTIKTQINRLLRKFGCERSKEIVSMIRDMNIEHLFH